MSLIERPIYLIGLPGVGKTTLGRALSAHLSVPFIDLDEAIVADAGMTIPQIFAAEGESGFRRRESQLLRDICASPAIIACGGGTPCQPGNMELMNDTGTTVCLFAPISLLASRIASQPGTRPMFNNADIESKVRELANKRKPFYDAAQHRFDASLLESTQQIEATTQRFVCEILNAQK